ncbi:MAG: hypothetical protein ACK4IK_06725 [Bacteroidia bacterium]
MIKKFLFVFCFLISQALHAQDTIYLKNNNATLQVKVIEINDTAVVYKRYASDDLPLIILNKAKVQKVVFENGNIYEVDFKKLDKKIFDNSIYKNGIGISANTLLRAIIFVGYQRRIGQNSFLRFPISFSFYKHYISYEYANYVFFSGVGYHYHKQFDNFTILYGFTTSGGFIDHTYKYNDKNKNVLNYDRFIYQHQLSFDCGVYSKITKKLDLCYNISLGLIWYSGGYINSPYWNSYEDQKPIFFSPFLRANLIPYYLF